jgi:hypothetical protein
MVVVMGRQWTAGLGNTFRVCISTINSFEWFCIFKYNLGQPIFILTVVENELHITAEVFRNDQKAHP